jgi:hypothetical protein
MLVKTECKRQNETSYWGDRVFASFNELVKVFGKPSSTNDDKSFNTWVLIDDKERVCGLYDSHQRFDPCIEPDEKLWWHIGAHHKTASYNMKVIITNQIKTVIHGQSNTRLKQSA